MPDKRIKRLGSVLINGKMYKLTEEIGRGASSICYKANYNGKQYVVKEFYPIDIAERDRRGNVTEIYDEKSVIEFEEKKNKFLDAAEFHQNKLHMIQKNDFLTVIDIDTRNGFIVMNDTDGETLDKWVKKQRMSDSYIRQCVKIINGIIDEVEKFHEYGYLHLDLKVENIYKFNIENNQVLTRIFDFDSIQEIDELYEGMEFGFAHIHTTNVCYGREVQDINQQKADYITRDMLVRLDYYAIAKIFHYLLFGCYEKSVLDDDTDFDLLHGDCIVYTNYINNLFRYLCSDIRKRYYTAKDMKQYFRKIIFIINNIKNWNLYFNERDLKNHFTSNLMSDIGIYEWNGHDEVEQYIITMKHGETAIEQIVSQNDRDIFIHGYDGGRGKTTALRWLMFRRTSNIGGLYLYVPLNELQPNTDIAEQICRRYKLRKIPVNTILLLDGYNEIENVKTKKIFDKFFNGVYAWRIVISGRRREEQFNHMRYCTLEGVSDKTLKKISNENLLELDENLRSNPMIVSLYSGLSFRNLAKNIKQDMIGTRVKNVIRMKSIGEALWNYFRIQIYTKSNGDYRAADEYEYYLFSLLPLITRYAEGYYDSVNIVHLPLSEYDKKAFERCNRLFLITQMSEDGEIRFMHQNYYEFFEAIDRLREIKACVQNFNTDTKKLPQITPLTADLMGAAHCVPIIRDNTLTVPVGYINSYFAEGKKIVESAEKVKYADNENLMLRILELIRGNENISDKSVRNLLEYLPKNNMNFSSLNIGWLLNHNEELHRDLHVKTDECIASDIYALDTDIYSDTSFDKSLINLQDNSEQFFRNCSFKNLKGNSVFPYFIYMQNETDTVQIGNCIYSADKKILLDYTGGKSGSDEIIIFEETEKIGEHFRINCKNPDAYITNRSRKFELCDNVLYKLDNYGVSLEFCQRNIERLELKRDINIIKSYACAYCKELVSIKNEAIDEEFIKSTIKMIQQNAFAYCDALKELVIVSPYHVESGIFEGCSRLSKVIFFSSLDKRVDLSLLKGCTSVKELYVKFFKTRGVAIKNDIRVKRCTRLKSGIIPCVYNCKSIDDKHQESVYFVFGNCETDSNALELCKTITLKTIYVPFEPKYKKVVFDRYDDFDKINVKRYEK